MNNKMYNTGIDSCTVCGSGDISVSLDIQQVPIHCNILWPTREEALSASLGDIKIGICNNCGHIFNLLFKPYSLEYGQEYENSLHFSPRFHEYAESIARRLIDEYDIHDKDIIEIGCGKGEFLMMMCELGNNRGVGFDKSYVPSRTGSETNGRVTFINEFYTSKYSHYSADIICCRHVLEHIQYPRDFLNNIKKIIGSRLDTKIFFEVPNVSFTLKDLGIWDLIYEHCSYFSLASIHYLFSVSGFSVLNVKEEYENQFITLEAIPAIDGAGVNSNHTQELNEIKQDVGMFIDRYNEKVKTWNEYLKIIKEKGQKTVIWGGGSKGVTFLNTMNIFSQVQYVIDLNPYKQGKFVPRTGQKIVAPEFLKEYRADIIIIMNPIYIGEIRKIVQEMQLDAKILIA